MRKVIAAYLIVGPGEAGRMLEPVLRQLHWADEICICMNNVDEATKELCYRYGTILRHDDREWGREQWRIKQDFLSALVPLITAPHLETWIWCMDADEIFDARFDRSMAERMTHGHDVAWYFWCLQYWNDPSRVRMDLSFPNVRFWKVVPELGLHFQAVALHCGLAPRYAYQYGSQSGLWFGHYGLMKAEDRARKVARYAKYDPEAKYKGKSWYDALRNEKAASLPTDEAISRIPEFIYRNKPLKARSMSRNPEVFMFTNKHGKPVQAVGQKQREEFLKRGMKELTEITVNPHPEAPVLEKGAADEAETLDAASEAKKNEPENVGESAGSGTSAGTPPKRKRSSKKA